MALRLGALPRHPEFRTGMRDMIVVAAGTSAWGLMTGVAMSKSGMHGAEIVLMAVLVFAGSSQLAAIPLLTAHAPISVVLAASFCVNLRFIVFSVHLRPYAMHRGTWTRLAGGYLMGDINYVLFTRRFARPAADDAGIATQDAYWLGLGVIGWTAWVLPSLAGIALGNVVSPSWGLGFAGILALVGMMCSMVTTSLRAVSGGMAAMAAVASISLPLRLSIVTSIAVAVAACLLLEAPLAARRGLE